MMTTAMRLHTRGHGYLIVALALTILVTRTPAVAQIDTTKALITLRGRNLTPEKLRHLLEKQTGCETHIAPGLDHLPFFSLDIRNSTFHSVNTSLAPFGLALKAESRTIFIRPLSV